MIGDIEDTSNLSVKDLINQLKDLPEEAEVKYIWDGAARSGAKFIWLSNSGDVMISDGDVVYYTEDGPPHAPAREEDKHWYGEDLYNRD